MMPRWMSQSYTKLLHVAIKYTHDDVTYLLRVGITQGGAKDWEIE